MHTEIAHKNLMDEINLIKTSEKHVLFLNLLQQKQYQEALFWGCKNCPTEDTVMTKLLTIMLRHAPELSLNVNQQEGLEVASSGALAFLGEFLNYLTQSNTEVLFETALFYAVQSKNYSLVCRLQKAGATMSQALHDIWLKDLGKAHNTIVAQWIPDYKKQVEELNMLFNKLPLKESQSTDQENATHDSLRIILILRIINHISKYHSDLKNSKSVITGSLNAFEAEVLYIHRVGLVRDSLIQISTIVANLSRATRQKYEEYLQPHSWITLEQLGGAIKEYSDTYYHVHIGKLTPNKIYQSQINSATVKSFTDEHSDHDLLVEEMIPDLAKEIPLLKPFFSTIYRNLMQDTSLPVDTVTLDTIYITTRYFNEIKCLIELLALLNPGDHGLLLMSHNKTLELTAARNKHYSLASKIGKHSLLRTLQKIGELLTSKNSYFLDFDGSLALQALVTLRNGITHKEQKLNAEIIERLLNDPVKLRRVAVVELPYLLGKIEQFVNSREALYGNYRGDPLTHWGNVLRVEQERIKKEKEKEKNMVPVNKRRISLEKEQEFFSALEEAFTKEHIQYANKSREEVEQELRGIFDGTKDLTGLKQMKGELLRPLATFKKTNSELYTKLSSLLNEAMEPGSGMSKDERNAARVQTREECKERQQKKRERFIGLETIRDLADEINTGLTSPGRGMSPIKKIDAAMEALSNIKEFLHGEGYLLPNLPYKTMEEWDKFHTKANRKTLVPMMLDNPQLNAAVEYNAGQLLQLLDTLRECKETASCKHLHEQYETLRSLRNYIEHDHPLIESYDDVHNSTSPHFGKRQKLIYTKLITLVFELPLELEKIKNAMENPGQSKGNAITSRTLSGELKSLSTIDDPGHLNTHHTLPSLGGQGFFARAKNQTVLAPLSETPAKTY